MKRRRSRSDSRAQTQGRTKRPEQNVVLHSKSFSWSRRKASELQWTLKIILGRSLGTTFSSHSLGLSCPSASARWNLEGASLFCKVFEGLHNEPPASKSLSTQVKACCREDEMSESVQSSDNKALYPRKLRSLLGRAAVISDKLLFSLPSCSSFFWAVEDYYFWIQDLEWWGLVIPYLMISFLLIYVVSGFSELQETQKWKEAVRWHSGEEILLHLWSLGLHSQHHLRRWASCRFLDSSSEGSDTFFWSLCVPLCTHVCIQSHTHVQMIFKPSVKFLLVYRRNAPDLTWKLSCAYVFMCSECL